MRKSLFFIVFVAMVVAGSSLCTAQTIKIGVFNPQRVSEETVEGKRIQTTLAGFQAEKQAELNALEESIQSLQQQLSTQALSLSPDKKTNLEKDIQKLFLELNASREAATQELQLEVNSAQTRFQEQLFMVVERFGRDEGFDLILDANLIAWADEKIDVTTAVIDLFNKMIPAVEATPATESAPAGEGN